MKWRYQPVILIEPDGSEYIELCEMHFDDNGKLELWTDPGIQAGGTTIEELGSDLMRMYVDAMSWTPIRHDELYAGMRFSKALTMAQRKSLADFTEKIAHNVEQTRKK